MRMQSDGAAALPLDPAVRPQWLPAPAEPVRLQDLLLTTLLLQAAGTSTRVADTALSCGFSHLGEFSRAYRRRFGETPIRTLARR